MNSILFTLLISLLFVLSSCTLPNTPHINTLEKEAKEKATHQGKIYKNVIYKSTLFHTIKLDIYEPFDSSIQKAPVYLYIHGGSWLHGDKELVNIYANTMQTLRENGIAVVSIDYRFISQSGIEAMISDCFDALSFLQKNNLKYRLDPHTIGIHGHSAGANLALILGLNISKKSKDILFIVDEYGPSNSIKLLNQSKKVPWWSVFISNSDLEELSPIMMIHSHVPPIYIAHGDADKTVPLSQSKNLYKELLTLGVKTQLHILNGADHGYKGLSKVQIKRHREEVLNYMLKAYKKR